MVARAIHHSGPFRDKRFIPVDCGSLVPTLIESELFGYVKGAFTGAMQSKEGLLAIAEIKEKLAAEEAVSAGSAGG
jgi:transcriptional regulator with GAF, ATPase, and Fis domain